MKQEIYHWLYGMDLYREHFANVGALDAAMLNAIKFYEMVHENGKHLVGPINLHKVFINPEDGHFQVEAGDDKEALLQDIDSIKFMPPEILNKQCLWCAESDMFALAELLFVLRYCKHPYDGRVTLRYPITDAESAGQIYANSHFVFDPDNADNHLDYYTDSESINMWENESNAGLKNMFIKVFTLGYYDMHCRFAENDWKQIIKNGEV